jgi:hypothetical protein
LAGIPYQPKIISNQKVDEPTPRQCQTAEKKENLNQRRHALTEQKVKAAALDADPVAHLVVDLLSFHQRERKQADRVKFERLEKTDEELIDDDSCLYDARITDRQSLQNGVLFQCEYDAGQPVRKDNFTRAVVKGTALRVNTIDFSNGESIGQVEFRMPTEPARTFCAERITLLADGPFIDTHTLESRLCDVADAFFKKSLSNSIRILVYRKPPTFKKASDSSRFWPINRTRFPEGMTYLHAITQAVTALDHSVLCIQGPPGAGKTSTAKEVITALVRAGKRIGVMSNSHAAILNLLDTLHQSLPSAKIAKIGGFEKNQDRFSAQYPQKTYPNYVYRPKMDFTKAEPYSSFSVLGATAFAFANDLAFQSPLDYLFVDEASQVALAHLLAVVGCAHNIVLMGDQMQLPQPVQGRHPGESGQSALSYLLGEHRVIPEDRGIFLDITYRMHPALCTPLSDIVYEGKLKAAPTNGRQQISQPGTKPHLSGYGIWTIDVEHEGNQHRSEEEAAVIVELITDLKKQHFTPKKGKARLITARDILVVAPYNLQVNLL